MQPTQPRPQTGLGAGAGRGEATMNPRLNQEQLFGAAARSRGCRTLEAASLGTVVLCGVVVTVTRNDLYLK